MTEDKNTFLYRIVSRHPAIDENCANLCKNVNINPSEIITLDTIWSTTCEVVLRSKFMIGWNGDPSYPSCEPSCVFELDTNIVSDPDSKATDSIYKEAKQQLAKSFYLAKLKAWCAFAGFMTEEFSLKFNICYPITTLDPENAYELANSRSVIPSTMYNQTVCYRDAILCDPFDRTFMYLMNDRRIELCGDELAFSYQCMSNKMVRLPDDLSSFSFFYVHKEDAHFLVKRYRPEAVSRSETGIRFSKLIQMASFSFVDPKSDLPAKDGRKTLTISLPPELYDHVKNKADSFGNSSKYIQSLIQNDSKPVHYPSMDQMTQNIIKSFMDEAERGNLPLWKAIYSSYGMIHMMFDTKDGSIYLLIDIQDPLKMSPNDDQLPVNITWNMPLKDHDTLRRKIWYRPEDATWMLPQARRLVELYSNS